MDTFVTLFNSSYLSRGLAMIMSLRKWLPESRVVILCVDLETKSRLSALNIHNLFLIDINVVLDPEVLLLREERTLGEFCWTLTPIALEIGLKYSANGVVTYLDADLYFFSSPAIILDNIRKSKKSISITPHDFSPHLVKLIVYGKYCVQWITIADNDEGRHCLQKYKEQCLEWCYNDLDENRFGDQKYLDAWPDEYPGSVYILNPKEGFGAPWNIINHVIEIGNDDKLRINGSRLIFFHFHQFKIFRNNQFYWFSRSYGSITKAIRAMYLQYETAILEARELLGPQYSGDMHQGYWFSYYVKEITKSFVPSFIKNAIRNFHK